MLLDQILKSITKVLTLDGYRTNTHTLLLYVNNHRHKINMTIEKNVKNQAKTIRFVAV